jgi:hypothetical protein
MSHSERPTLAWSFTLEEDVEGPAYSRSEPPSREPTGPNLQGLPASAPVAVAAPVAIAAPIAIATPIAVAASVAIATSIAIAASVAIATPVVVSASVAIPTPVIEILSMLLARLESTICIPDLAISIRLG